VCIPTGGRQGHRFLQGANSGLQPLAECGAESFAAGSGYNHCTTPPQAARSNCFSQPIQQASCRKTTIAADARCRNSAVSGLAMSSQWKMLAQWFKNAGSQYQIVEVVSKGNEGVYPAHLHEHNAPFYGQKALATMSNL
jgi:hypothetical protein